MGVERLQGQRRRVDLELADAAILMQHLTGKITQLHPVAIEQDQPAHTGRRQILTGRAAEATEPYHQHG